MWVRRILFLEYLSEGFKGQPSAEGFKGQPSGPLDEVNNVRFGILFFGRVEG